MQGWKAMLWETVAQMHLPRLFFNKTATVLYAYALICFLRVSATLNSTIDLLVKVVTFH